MARVRLRFLDNLRVLVIALVMVTHLSITYGGEGSWYYKEGGADLLTFVPLTLNNAVVQSFAMGLLFAIAGYFTPNSLDRKGAGRFLRDRLLRLGIPLLVYDYVVHPLLLVFLGEIAGCGEAAYQGYLDYLSTGWHLGSGPLWFVETLLALTIFYVGWRWASKRRDGPRRADAPSPRLKTILAFAAVLGVLTFLVRLWFPIGWAFRPLNLQLCFFIQYIGMYIAGAIAYRRGWLMRLPPTLGPSCLRVARRLLLIGMPLLFLLGGAMSDDVSRFFGGFRWQALVYALWEQCFGVTLIVGLLVRFRERLNHQGPFAREASVCSYTIYVIHAPVIVVLAVAVRNIRIYPLLKFALVAAIAIPLCFLLAAGVRRLPLARRVL